MKNIVITSVAALAVLAFAGCAPKKSCGTTPTPVKVPVKAPVVVTPTPAPVVKPAPIVVPQEIESVVVPYVDAKESAVR